MKFEQYYPCLSKEKIDLAWELAEEDCQQILEDLLVYEILNPHPEKKKVVGTCLFAKPADATDSLKIPEDLHKLHPNIRHGAMTWMDGYFNPGVANIEPFIKHFPDWNVVVYLASDLESFAPRLAEIGCEVRMVRGTSIAHNPGACWRLMVMDDLDSDCEAWTTSDFEDIKINEGIGHFLGENFDKWFYGQDMFRWSCCGELDETHMIYRPLGAQYVFFKKKPVTNTTCRVALAAFHFLCENGMMPTVIHHPEAGTIPLFGAGNEWPKYGGDEQFWSQWAYWQFAGRMTSYFSCHKFKDLGPVRLAELEYQREINPDCRFFLSPNALLPE